MDRHSASHTVLQNVFLVHEILKELSNSTCKKKDLCRAALVSSAFRKPAQDIIWREVPSIWVLLKLLLHKFRCVAVVDILLVHPNTKSWYIFEELVADDLELLKRFGSRIRVLHRVFADMDPLIEPSVFVMIASALGNQPLVPNLRVLEIVLVAERPSDAAVLPLLHSTSLESVQLSMFHPHYRPFASELTNRFYAKDYKLHTYDPVIFLRRLQNSKHLKHLGIDYPMNITVLKLALSLQSLTSLDLLIRAPHSIDIDFLWSLSQFDHLEKLSIGSDHDGKFGWGHTPRNPKLHFPTLNSLTLCAFVEDATRLFSSLSAPSLEQLEYYFILPRSPETHTYAWLHLLNGIKDSSPLIWRITIEPIDVSGITVENRSLNFFRNYPGVLFDRIMPPLLRLKLRYFGCDFPLFHSLCQDNLESVAYAWPDLKTFFVRCASETVVLDTSALSFISNNFHKLEELELDVNTATIVTHNPSRPGMSHGLKYLNLRLINWDETPQNITTLSSLIDSAFPELVPSESSEFTDLSGEIIEAFVIELRETRLRERNRLAIVTNHASTDQPSPLALKNSPLELNL